MNEQTTEYLNVDLEIIATYDLQPLVAALGQRVSALYVGPHKRGRYLASLEVMGVTRSVEATITRFVSMICALPPGARRLWRKAAVRDLDVGIQAGNDAGTLRLSIRPGILRAAAQIDARLVVTVYGSGVRALPKHRSTVQTGTSVDYRARRRPRRA